MSKAVVNLLVCLYLFVGTALASAGTVEKIEAYGVYVSTKDGYVKVEPYQKDYRFIDFKYLNEIPFVQRSDEKLKLVVYAKDFSANSLVLELRPIEIKVKLNRLNVNVKPLDVPGMYEVTVDSPIQDGAILHVQYWGIYDNFGAIVLGNTREALIQYFSQKELSNASAISQYLDDALVAFPDSTKLQELSSYWKVVAAEEQDKRDYAYVDEKWQQYEGAEKLTLKQRYLNAVIGEINGYLNQHPNGVKAAEAKERKAVAEKKLKEYDKLL